MWDENLLFNADANGDAVAMTLANDEVRVYGSSTPADANGYLDLWGLNADLAVQFSEYEGDDPPAGGAVRPLVVEFVMTGGDTGHVQPVQIGIEYADDDGAGTPVDNDDELIFAELAVADIDLAADTLVRRTTIQPKAQYARFFIQYTAAAGGGGDITCLVGLRDGGEYTDF